MLVRELFAIARLLFRILFELYLAVMIVLNAWRFDHGHAMTDFQQLVIFLLIMIWVSGGKP